MSEFSVIVLCGNDGTGKSTLVREVNQRFRAGQSKFIAVERSTALDVGDATFSKISTLDRKVLDAKTLLNTFDRPENDEEDLPTACNGVPIIYVVLDVDVAESERRLAMRAERDEWESNKALFYFRQRFLELASYYGLPVVRNQDYSTVVETSIKMAVNAVLCAASTYYYYRTLALRTLTFERIQELDIENALYKLLLKEEAKEVPVDYPLEWFGLASELASEKNTLAEVVARLRARCLLAHATAGDITVHVDGAVVVSSHTGSYTLPAQPDGARYLQLVVEGESKRVYRVVSTFPGFESLCIIKLKSTIYSHKSQATGEIAQLANVRANGSQMLLEIMARNGLPHAYRCVSRNGIVMATFVNDIPPTEVVVKRYCLGTDKHLFHGALQLADVVVPTTGEYRCGPYVRFDWRNPNHVDRKTLQNPLVSLYYYVVESIVGKEEFFNRFLKGDDSLFKPIGDTATTDAVVSGVLDCDRARVSVLRMFLATQHYLGLCEPPLTIQDACYMTDKSGTLMWSEINQDCCRLKMRRIGASVGSSDAYDKDIWRVGGSASKDQVLLKWRQFNEMVGKALRARPFHTTEMLQPTWFAYAPEAKQILDDTRLAISAQYKQIFGQLVALPAPATTVGEAPARRRRSVIVTIDLHDGRPVLVRQGKVSEVHSGGDVVQALARICVFPDILMVDLNGAFGETNALNRKLICKTAKDYYVHTGGGLRTMADVQTMLESSVRRVVVGTATDEAFLAAIPRERLIVEVSVDDQLYVMTHGRATTTATHVRDEMLRLGKAGVTAVSVTFHATEGGLAGLPRAQVAQVVRFVPPSISKIIIAGGISSMDDVEFLWSLDARVVPQLGSAIWKNKIGVGELMAAMVYYDQVHVNGELLAPAIVQCKDGRVSGLVWMNKHTVCKSAEERILWRYSRQHSCALEKGASSGNRQRVLKMSADCDSDALLITVDGDKPFCHTGADSCFSLQTVIKASLSGLNDYLRRARGESSYTAHMQGNPGMAFAKLLEELWEVACATSDEERKNEMADLLVHFLMYANGTGVSLDSLLNELNSRRYNPHLVATVVSTSTQRMMPTNVVTIAITAEKYWRKTDAYVRDFVGVTVSRPESGSRSLLLRATITDMAKFQSIFGADKTGVALVGSRPKDMSFLLSRGRVDACVTYNATMLNFPSVSLPPLAEQRDASLRICLVARKDDIAARDEKSWTRQQKCLIAAEHVLSVSGYLQQKGVDMSTVTLDRVMGSSEGFLTNESNRHYTLCDAIVETGETLTQNGLEIVSVVLDDIKMGVYKAIKRGAATAVVAAVN